MPELLVSAVCDDDEEAAAALCATLAGTVESLGGAAAGAGTASEDDLTLLLAPVTLGEGPRLTFEQAEAAAADNKEAWGAKVRYNVERDATVVAVSKRDERKAAKEMERARVRLDAQSEGGASDGGVAAMVVPERDGAHSGNRDVRVSNFDIHFGGNTLLRGAELRLAYGTRLPARVSPMRRPLKQNKKNSERDGKCFRDASRRSAVRSHRPQRRRQDDASPSHGSVRPSGLPPPHALHSARRAYIWTIRARARARARVYARASDSLIYRRVSRKRALSSSLCVVVSTPFVLCGGELLASFCVQARAARSTGGDERV